MASMCLHLPRNVKPGHVQRYRKFIKVDNVELSKLIPKTKNTNIRTFNVQSKDKIYTVELDTLKNRYRLSIDNAWLRVVTLLSPCLT
jgi:hypothetical protein